MQDGSDLKCPDAIFPGTFGISNHSTTINYVIFFFYFDVSIPVCLEYYTCNKFKGLKRSQRGKEKSFWNKNVSLRIKYKGIWGNSHAKK